MKKKKMPTYLTVCIGVCERDNKKHLAEYTTE